MHMSLTGHALALLVRSPRLVWNCSSSYALSWKKQGQLRLQLRFTTTYTSPVAVPDTTNTNMTNLSLSSSKDDYTTWSREALISRINQLEVAAQKRPSGANPKTSKTSSQPFDFSRYTNRLIALKFAYIGRDYQGLEYHTGSSTALPTVEEKLFEALLKARLVPPRARCHSEDVLETTPSNGSREIGGEWSEGSDLSQWIDLEAWQYTKCGRTDRGVSAFGQVVGVRVRSNRPKVDAQSATDMDVSDGNGANPEPDDRLNNQSTDFDDADELPYVTILNRLLPPTIRVLAWCPNPPENFSARFDCKARTYHYFFTNPPSPPDASSPPKLLDVAAMRKAAKFYEGLHDFRNLCKVDASKQITNFKRRVEESDIVKVGGVSPVFALEPLAECDADLLKRRPEVYYFKLTGSAFLWHQVRHMVAVLFLVGQGFERPEVVQDLLDVKAAPTKPMYNMADDRPLVLWDCIFDEEEVKWIYPDVNGAKRNSKENVLGALWELWHNSNMDALLSGGLMAMIYEQQRRRESTDTAGKQDSQRPLVNGRNRKPTASKESTWIVDGSPLQSSFGKYVTLMKRDRMEAVDDINRKYAARKSEEWRQKWSVEAKRERGIGVTEDSEG